MVHSVLDGILALILLLFFCRFVIITVWVITTIVAGMYNVIIHNAGIQTTTVVDSSAHFNHLWSSR